jgi:ABC-type glycerol-3-phosphate transport system permease component
MVLRSIRVQPTRLLIFVVLCVIGASTVYPLLFMALNSFRSNNAYQVNPYGLPTSFGLGNFSDLLSSYPFAASLLHSVIVVVPAVALATLFSALAGFVFAKTPFRYSNALFYLMLSVILMPGVVLIIPLYVLVAHAGLANSFGPAILVYAAINIPFGTYLLRANFRSIPDGLIDAARVDGAGWLRVFWAIVLPTGRAAVVTVAILTFLNAWNELFISIVLLHTPATEMVTPTITEINGRYTTDVPVLLSGLLLAALPTLLVYIVTARVFVRGLLSGSVR